MLDEAKIYPFIDAVELTQDMAGRKAHRKATLDVIFVKGLLCANCRRKPFAR
jgi:hypothetical protein